MWGMSVCWREEGKFVNLVKDWCVPDYSFDGSGKQWTRLLRLLCSQLNWNQAGWQSPEQEFPNLMVSNLHIPYHARCRMTSIKLWGAHLASIVSFQLFKVGVEGGSWELRSPARFSLIRCEGGFFYLFIKKCFSKGAGQVSWKWKTHTLPFWFYVNPH